MNIFSFFSGAGFLDLGFETAKHLKYNEAEAVARTTSASLLHYLGGNKSI